MAESVVDTQELSFIQQLFADPKGKPLLTHNGLLEVQPNWLLPLLACAEGMSLSADFQEYRLIFYPLVQLCPVTGKHRFQLGYPQVVERSSQRHSTRIQPEFGDIRLQDADGQQLDAEILDLSATGMALRLKQLPASLDQALCFHLQLTFPDGEQSYLSTQLIRTAFDFQKSEFRVGLQFIEPADNLQQQLNRYILQRLPQLDQLARELNA